MKNFLTFVFLTSAIGLFAQEQEPPKQPPKEEPKKSVQLEWDSNNDVDLIRGFRLYWGTVSGTYTKHVDILKDANGTLVEATEVKELIADTKYFFVVTALAVEDDALESMPSNEVEWTSPKNLSKPFNLRTTIAMNADGTKKIVFNIEGGDPGKKAKLLSSVDLETWLQFGEVDINENGEGEAEALMNDEQRMFFKAEI